MVIHKKNFLFFSALFQAVTGGLNKAPCAAFDWQSYRRRQPRPMLQAACIDAADGHRQKPKRVPCRFAASMSRHIVKALDFLMFSHMSKTNSQR
jgi:hypothetical protein